MSAKSVVKLAYVKNGKRESSCADDIKVVLEPREKLPSTAGDVDVFWQHFRWLSEQW